MTTIVLFVFGMIVGSFLNVVATRWPNSVGGRSKCPHCSKTLSWYELIPVISFFIQKRKCRHCKTKISWQYPLIEILTGLIFVTVPFWMFPVFCIYIVILIYDFHHKIIPDPLVYLAIILSLVLGWQILAGLIIFTFFAAIWLLSRGRAIGFGDAKLGLSVGFLLGTAQGFSAIIVAFWIGAAVSLFLMRRKKLTIKSEIPFAPFIILGAWITVFFGLDILHVLSF